MRNKKRIVLVLVLSVLVQGYSQNFSYKKVPNTFLSVNRVTKISRQKTQNSLTSGVNLTRYLPKNYSIKGDVDYTEFIQKGIDENSNVIMPDFPVLVNVNGIKLKSGTNVLFQANSKLILKANSAASYSVILIDGINNVNIYYPNIVGDKYSHLGSEGQWGMGIWIINSKNINVYNPNVSKCWGDGIYIGNQSDQSSENINIYNAILDDNRRNGISITSGVNILLENPIISNTDGHNPKSGIDIEPNTNKDRIENIKINNALTYNNASSGILIFTGGLAGIDSKKISININNNRDYYSSIGLAIGVALENKPIKNIVNGNINITNSKFYYNSDAAIKNLKGEKHNVHLVLKSPTIQSNSKKNVKKLGNEINSFLNNFATNNDATIK